MNATAAPAKTNVAARAKIEVSMGQKLAADQARDQSQMARAARDVGRYVGQRLSLGSVQRPFRLRVRPDVPAQCDSEGQAPYGEEHVP